MASTVTSSDGESGTDPIISDGRASSAAVPNTIIGMPKNESSFIVYLSAAVQAYRYEEVRISVSGTNPPSNGTQDENETYGLHMWVPTQVPGLTTEVDIQWDWPTLHLSSSAHRGIGRKQVRRLKAGLGGADIMKLVVGKQRRRVAYRAVGAPKEPLRATLLIWC